MVKQINMDDLYFAANEAGLYLENLTTSEISFGYFQKTEQTINRKELKRKVFDLCNAFGELKEIRFDGGRVMVKFE